MMQGNRQDYRWRDDTARCWWDRLENAPPSGRGGVSVLHRSSRPLQNRAPGLARW